MSSSRVICHINAIASPAPPEGVVASGVIGHRPRLLRHPENVLVDGGFITAADMRYHFFVTDHLGNVRVVVNDAGVVELVNQFYLYGEATDMGQALPASVDNPYKWSSKEWDEDQGAYMVQRLFSPGNLSSLIYL